MGTERIKIAIEFLKEGQSFKVGDLRLGMSGKDKMYVTGWSQYIYIENLTKYEALQELEHIKTLFKQMVESSNELKKFIQDKSIKYNLAFYYGMGAINICSEKNEIVEWAIELQ